MSINSIELNVTNHAEERLRKRCGLPKKAVEKSAEKAWSTGLTHSECKGNLRNLAAKIKRNKTN